MITLELMAGILVGFLITYFITPLIIKLDHYFGFFSISSKRDIHSGKIPTLGGFGFYVFLMTYILLFQVDFFPYPQWSILLILTFATFIGLLDDIWGLSPVIKFMFLVVLIIFMLYSGIYVRSFVYPAGYVLELGMIGIIVSGVFIFIVINAFNFIDGMDGLAAGISVITLLGLSVINYMNDNYALLFLGMGMIGALGGFLKYNWHPAKIFMGDTGSLLLGTLFSILIFSTFYVSSQAMKLFPAVIILAIPIGDFVLSFIRRLHEGISPVQPDKEHLHHRLMKLGLNYHQTLIVLYFLSFIAVVLAIYVYWFHNSISLLLSTVFFSMIVFIIFRMGYFNFYHQTIITEPEKSQEPGAIVLPVPLRFNLIIHKLLLLVADIIALNLGFIFFLYLRSSIVESENFILKSNPEVLILLTMFWILLFLLNNLYSLSWDISIFFKTVKIFKTIVFGILLLGVFTFNQSTGLTLSQIQSLIYYGISLVFFVISFRLTVIFLEGKFKILQYSYKNTLILGTNKVAKQLIKDFKTNPALLYNIVGVIKEKETSQKTFAGVKVLGSAADLTTVFKNNYIEEIIITEFPKKNNVLNQLINVCASHNVVVKTVPQLEEMFSPAGLGEVTVHRLVKIFRNPILNWQLIIKRFLDIFISLFLISVSSILLICMLPLGKFSWSNLFEEKNVTGLRGERIQIKLIKHANQKPSITMKLIKYLPVYFKILTGKFSLVGIEPKEIEWYEKNKSKIPFIYQRLIIKPGITGLSKIYQRSYISQQDDLEKVKYDLFYRNNFSLALDMRILIRTVILLLKDFRNK